MIRDEEKRNYIKLNNWSITTHPSFNNEWVAPEAIPKSLRGKAINHPKGPKEWEVITSSVKEVCGRYVRTRSGTLYKLGPIKKEYKKWIDKNYKNWDWRNPIKLI